MRKIFPLLAVLLLTACQLAKPTSIPAIQPAEASPYPQPAATSTKPPEAYPQPQVKPTEPPTPYPQPEASAAPAVSSTPNQALMALAGKVVNALKEQDFQALASYADPQNGVRFSPYANVSDSDLVFTAAQIPALMTDATKYTWGVADGSGQPIELTFGEYYAKFIYDVDFASAPQVALNQRLGVSTTIDNSAEYYPGAMIVEYYFPGSDPKFSGMDWHSLRLVFQEYQGQWYLSGIIHDQWTT